MRAALAELGFPAWQADGLLEEFAMYCRGEAAEIEPGLHQPWADVLGHLSSSREITLRRSPEDVTKQVRAGNGKRPLNQQWTGRPHSTGSVRVDQSRTFSCARELPPSDALLRD